MSLSGSPVLAQIRTYCSVCGSSSVYALSESFQVHVHHPRVPFICKGATLLQCIVATLAGAEAIAAWREFGFIDFRQHLGDGLLHHPVHDPRDSQVSRLAPFLRYLDP